MSGNGAKRKRTRYDDKFRASAVVMLEAAGYPGKEGALTQTANHLKVPINTLKGWFTAERNPPPAELRNEKKAELSIELERVAYALVRSIPGKIEDANLQQTTTSLGIVIDKMQLLQGKPTLILELADLLKEGKITPQDILDEFADTPEVAQGLFESIGLRATEIEEAQG